MPLHKANLSSEQNKLLTRIDDEWDDYIAPAICNTRFARIPISTLFPSGLEHGAILEKSRTGRYLHMTVKSLYEHKADHGFASHLDSELHTTVRSRIEHKDRMIQSYLNEVHSHKVWETHVRGMPKNTRGANIGNARPFLQPTYSTAFVDSMLVDTIKRAHSSWASKFMTTCSELDLVTTQTLLHPPLVQERMYRSKLTQVLSKGRIEPVVFKLMSKYSHLNAMTAGRQLGDHSIMSTTHRAFHEGYRCYWTTTINGLAALAVGTNGENKDVYAAQILKYIAAEFDHIINMNYDPHIILEKLSDPKNIQLNREVPNRLKVVIRTAVTTVEWSRLHDLSELMRMGLAKKFDNWLCEQAERAQQSAIELAKTSEVRQNVLTQDAWVGAAKSPQSGEALTWDDVENMFTHGEVPETSQSPVSSPRFLVENTFSEVLPDLGNDLSDVLGLPSETEEDLSVGLGLLSETEEDLSDGLGLLSETEGDLNVGLGLSSETDEDLSPAPPKRCRVEDLLAEDEDLSFLDDFIDYSPTWPNQDFEEFR